MLMLEQGLNEFESLNARMLEVNEYGSFMEKNMDKVSKLIRYLMFYWHSLIYAMTDTYRRLDEIQTEVWTHYFKLFKPKQDFRIDDGERDSDDDEHDDDSDDID